MALPLHVKKEHLDKGIIHLVINLNKIPGVNTMTTCEGHVWRDTPLWPAKNGWIHFYKEKNTHQNLIVNIEDFCSKNKYFTLDTGIMMDKDKYCINACFEDHVDKNYYKRPKELEEYFSRVDKEKVHILNGWNELNRIVVGYIKENISRNINNLSYREKFIS